MTDSDLKRIEQATYRAAADSGLWDLFLASVVAMFAIAPLLSVRMGDFWSSAVFLPVWAVIIVAIRVVQIRVVRPRLGAVEFAPARRKRLLLLTVVMLAMNLVALVVGVVAAIKAPTPDGQIVATGLSLAILVGFSLTAFFLGIPRVFAYGLLLAAAPPVGEALFVRGHASHHGFPVVFSVCAAVILVCGILRFVRFLPKSHGADGQPLVEGTYE